MRSTAPYVLALRLFAVAAAGPGCASAPDPTPLNRPPDGPVLVVANQEQGHASLLELRTGRLFAHVDVGMNPHEGAASPDGRHVALVSPSTLFGDARHVALIDVEAGSLVRRIDLGRHRWPHGIAFVNAATLLVSSRAAAAVAVVDVSSGAVEATIDNGGSRPYLLHVARATGRIYTSNPSSGTVTELDQATRRLLRTFHVPEGPVGFAVSPNGAALWIATWDEARGSGLVVLETAGGTITARLEGSAHPRRLAFTDDGSRVVVTDSEHLRVFDADSHRELGRVHLARDAVASGVVCAPGSDICYAALMRTGEVLEVDVRAMEIRRRFGVGEGADGLVFVPR